MRKRKWRRCVDAIVEYPSINRVSVNEESK